LFEFFESTNTGLRTLDLPFLSKNKLNYISFQSFKLKIKNKKSSNSDDRLKNCHSFDHLTHFSYRITLYAVGVEEKVFKINFI
jgi:hypothetical protein